MSFGSSKCLFLGVSCILQSSTEECFTTGVSSINTGCWIYTSPEKLKKDLNPLLVHTSIIQYTAFSISKIHRLHFSLSGYLATHDSCYAMNQRYIIVKLV